MGKEQIGEGFDVAIPDVIEPITGFRTWQWDNEGLCSQRGTRWTPGVALKGECKKNRYFSWTGLGSEIPRPESTFPDVCPSDPRDTVRHGPHGCGIYAYATVEDAWANLGEYSCRGDVIMGEVELWGTVWPHEHGYRAEYARPKAFYRRVDAPKSSTSPMMSLYSPTHTTATPFWGDPVEKLAEMFGVPIKDMPLDGATRQRIIDEARRKETEAWARQIAEMEKGIAADINKRARGALSSFTYGHYLTTSTTGTSLILPLVADDPKPTPEPRRGFWSRFRAALKHNTWRNI